jgi:hypothetical protein
MVSGVITNVLNYWEQAGVFSYLIPFLLIFALVFGLLTKIQIFKENRAVNAIIALAVGLMALQFDFVPKFFSEIFPKLGIGLAIILILLILTGIFVDPDKPGLMYFFLGLGLIIAIIIVVQTAGSLNWTVGYWLQENWLALLGVLAFIVLIGLIIIGPRREKNTTYSPFLVRPVEK